MKTEEQVEKNEEFESLRAIDKIKLGFLGLGWIGKSRLEALRHSGLVNPIAMCEPCGENAQRIREIIPRRMENLSTAGEICARDDLDGVVIATPSGLHGLQSVMALESGKAVFCQKPIGRNAREVKQVMAVARANNLLFGVDMAYRYTRAFRKVYELVQSGDLGHVFAVNLVFHNAYGPDKPWFYRREESGGGCLMDLGIHLLDMAMYALDFPDAEVMCADFYKDGTRMNADGNEVEDFATTMIRTPSTVINLQCSWNLSAGKDADISAVFYGTRGAAVFRNVDGSFYDFEAEKMHGTQKVVLENSPDDWSGRAAVVWAEELMSGSRYDDRMAAEYIRIAELLDEISQKAAG